jgi:lipoprotein-anchoring transpeptidase ErfK/SrfK
MRVRRLFNGRTRAKFSNKGNSMIDRRTFVLGSVLAVAAPQNVWAAKRSRRAFKLAARYQPQLVRFSSSPVGTLVVDPRRRFLYLVEASGRARSYGVGVGRAGLAFRGRAIVARKAKWPRWTPTQNMIRREPHKYARFAKGLPGGPGNPLGARALYLYRNGRDTMYRIHGTTQPSSIGRAVSSGCIRMLNAHVADLYRRVPTGARVVVL